MKRSIRIKPLLVIIRHEILASLGNARALLFLVFFGLFWFWVLWKLSSLDLSILGSRDLHSFISGFIDQKHAQHLFVDHPRFLSVIFLAALSTLPFFTMIVACDQTASDVNSRYIRFLLPRINRTELFLGRYIGTAFFVAMAYILLTLVATIISWNIEPTEPTLLLSYAVRIALSLVLYSMAFAAFMAMVSSVTGSVGITLLLGIGGYFGFLFMLFIVQLQSKVTSEYLSYLLPSGIKPMLTSPDSNTIVLTMTGLTGYVLIYFFLGWLRFRSRDM